MLTRDGHRLHDTTYGPDEDSMHHARTHAPRRLVRPHLEAA
jgi:hypothetical protein